MRPNLRSQIGKPRTEQRETKRRATSGEKGYRVVSVSLYSDQAQFIDDVANDLVRGGFTKANRSLVMQTAIECLRKELLEKSTADVVRSVLDYQVRRPLAAASSRSATPDVQGGRRESAK